MAKGWKRAWVKMWVSECLDGSIREELEADERGVWYDLIIYSAKCRVPGVVSANETQPVSRWRLAGILNISEELLNRTIEKCVHSDRIWLDAQGLLHIRNWEKYQSESDRVRKYQKKKQQSFDDYVKQLRQEYSDLEFDRELEKFNLYWSEGPRKLQRPKLALRNWMDKARKIREEQYGKPKQQRARGPIKTIRGTEQVGPGDDEDMP